jgi:hypothetical protein
LLATLAGALCLALALRARRPAPPPRADFAALNVQPLGSNEALSRARQRLEQFEAERRRATDFSHLAPANRTHGADPYALSRLDSTHLVGVLRGASALVLLDNQLRELSRIELPGSAVALAVSDSGECWVAGETSHTLLGFHFDGRGLSANAELRLPHILGIRALAAGRADTLYALDVHDGRLLTISSARSPDPVRESRVIGHGPLSLRRVGSFLIVDVLLDHTLIVYRLAEDGRLMEERARVQHDGPIWGFDAALLDAGQLLLVATGVENHPLDRSDGSFGYIDSFVFSYLLPKVGAIEQLWQSNLSALGVVTPKAPLLRVQGGTARLFVSGYGSDRAASFSFEIHTRDPPSGQSEAFFPGTSAGLQLASGALAFADPLLDAWLLRPALAEGKADSQLEPVLADVAPLATSEERLGEALFFTTLIAPANSSEGKHSRFSCETCHFEGYVDGRVHSTGRADVRVATKPLRGLFNNRPHFSRALDADLATVSHHEFRVAGQGNGQDPWFELRAADFPWLAALSLPEPVIGPEALRRALIAFLMGFTHTTNPRVVGRQGFEAAELRGARLFRDRCARCHAARLQSDVPESALPFDAWQSAIFSSEGPVVWASAEYQMTGVTPYVHEAGTRVPSLRRLYTKWPHFTNGSADTLFDVVSRARFDGARFFHAGAPSSSALGAFTPPETGDLLAFLELL